MFDPGAAARVDTITGFIGAQDQPERSEVVVLRSMQDVDRLNTEPCAIAIAGCLLDEDHCQGT